MPFRDALGADVHSRIDHNHVAYPTGKRGGVNQRHHASHGMTKQGEITHIESFYKVRDFPRELLIAVCGGLCPCAVSVTAKVQGVDMVTVAKVGSDEIK